MGSAEDERERALASGAAAAAGASAETFVPAPAGSSPTSTGPVAALTERYELLAELGRGGMGAVHRARDRVTGEIIALKILNSDVAARPDLIERFKAEVRLARQITHKSACRVHELLPFRDAWAISMELVDGISLRKFLNRYGGVPLRRGIEWARQLCGALTEAHEHGIVHRDLKPENIMIDGNGQAKLMDFGIARSLDVSSTQTGALIGTPAYMSPEQAEGKPADARSDIYCLGLVLYEMFTGRMAFQADTPVALVLKQIHDTPVPPRQVENCLPPFLDRAIEKCLRKNPNERFQSAADLEAALQGRGAAPATARAPESAAQHVEPPLRLARWQRSDWVLLGAACASLIVFFALFDWVFAYSLLREMPAAEAKKIAAEYASRLGVQATPGAARHWEQTWYYPRLASFFGVEQARAWFSRRGSQWRVDFPDPSEPRVSGQVVRDIGECGVFQDGKVRWSTFNVLPEKIGRPKEGETREWAARTLSLAFGVDLHDREPVVKGLSGVSALRMTAEYRLAPASPLDDSVYSVAWWTDGFSLVNTWEADNRIMTHTGWRAVWFDSWDVYGGRDRRTFYIVCSLAAFAAVLCFLRRIHRQRVQWRDVLLTALFALAIACNADVLLDIITTQFWAVAASIDSIIKGMPGVWATSTVFVLKALGLVLVFALSYAALLAVRYYGTRSDPGRWASLVTDFKQPGASTAGLSVVRGVSLGLTFCGLFIVLLSVTSRLGLVIAVPANVQVFLWDQGSRLANREGLSPLYVGLRQASAALNEAAIIAWLLLAFPIALLRRVTSSRWVLIGAFGGLVILTGTLPGALLTYPDRSLYVVLLLASIFFGWVYLRWDLLTAATAIFTLDCWLWGWGTCRLLHDDSFGLLLPMLLSVALALAGAGFYFRTNLAAAWRRLTAVFE